MKFIFALLFATLFAQSSFAADVDGEIFYKVRGGELVSRSVTLDVPSRGQGEVVLKGERFEWRTTNFWTTRNEAGEVVFTAAFLTDFMGMQSTIALRGTYIKGTNLIRYDGSFYKKEGHVTAEEGLEGFRYNGGFSFSYDR
ncbi:MAG: hypothetical protein HRT45_06160 [Bdellovibrionales bacterium]|nr:hypothetical protein [Bdellovibrionales bacterium]